MRINSKISMPIEFIYIHIPFCKCKCNYCSFISTCNLKLKEQYIKSLINEIRANYKFSKLKTLYFGGGTPSLLSIDEIEKIIALFNFDETTEVTFEINPENITTNYLICLKNLGINRLSIGCQSFNDKILKEIGRKHTSKQAIDTIIKAQKAGFKNISVDLIYGLPNQTIADFEKDLDIISHLNIQHVSLYGLKIDMPCKFALFPPDNLPDDDIQADMYESAVKILEKNEFTHYEVSNFAKIGFTSKHNLNYWENNEYLGVGLAAHGYLNGIRYSNTEKIKDYIKNDEKKVYSHLVTFNENLEEEIFLGLRKVEGIDINKINKKFDINFEQKYKNILKKYIETKHLMKTGNRYAFTIKGLLISNNILSEFMQ